MPKSIRFYCIIAKTKCAILVFVFAVFRNVTIRNKPTWHGRKKWNRRGLSLRFLVLIRRMHPNMPTFGRARLWQTMLPNWVVIHVDEMSCLFWTYPGLCDCNMEVVTSQDDTCQDGESYENTCSPTQRFAVCLKTMNNRIDDQNEGNHQHGDTRNE